MIISKGESSSILTAGNQIYQVYRYLLRWPRCSTSNPFTRGRHKPINNCEKKKSLLGLKITKQYALDARRLDWPCLSREESEIPSLPIIHGQPFLDFRIFNIFIAGGSTFTNPFFNCGQMGRDGLSSTLFLQLPLKEKVARCSTRAK